MRMLVTHTDDVPHLVTRVALDTQAPCVDHAVGPGVDWKNRRTRLERGPETPPPQRELTWLPDAALGPGNRLMSAVREGGLTFGLHHSGVPKSTSYMRFGALSQVAISPVAVPLAADAIARFCASPSMHRISLWAHAHGGGQVTDPRPQIGGRVIRPGGTSPRSPDPTHTLTECFCGAPRLDRPCRTGLTANPGALPFGSITQRSLTGCADGSCTCEGGGSRHGSPHGRRSPASSG